jgi:hypothetical protein
VNFILYIQTFLTRIYIKIKVTIMKYSEFLQFKELLNQNNVTLEEYKKDPKLYEGILGKIGAGLWNLAKKGMQTAISKGLSARYKDTLNQKADAIKDWAVEEVQKAKSDPEHQLYNIFVAKKKNRNEDNKVINQKSEQIFDRRINKFIKDNVDIQVRRVEKNVEKNKKIEEDDKDLVIDYWKQLATQIELSVAMTLEEQGIISEDDVQDLARALMNVKRYGEPEQKPQTPEKTSTQPTEKPQK